MRRHRHLHQADRRPPRRDRPGTQGLDLHRREGAARAIRRTWPTRPSVLARLARSGRFVLRPRRQSERLLRLARLGRSPREGRRREGRRDPPPAVVGRWRLPPPQVSRRGTDEPVAQICPVAGLAELAGVEALDAPRQVGRHIASVRRRARLGRRRGPGAIAFGVLSFVAMMIANPPGGTYSASDATKYIEHGHRAAVFVSVYVFLIGAVGLVLTLARLRAAIADAGRASVFWFLGIAATAAWVAGYALVVAVPAASAYGGKSLSIDP